MVAVQGRVSSLPDVVSQRSIRLTAPAAYPLAVGAILPTDVIAMTRTASSKMEKFLPLPTKRGLSRDEAAEYVGVSSSKFDEMTKDGRMPQPKRIDGRRVWDIREIDDAFQRLPSDGNSAHNPWDD